MLILFYGYTFRFPWYSYRYVSFIYRICTVYQPYIYRNLQRRDSGVLVQRYCKFATRAIGRKHCTDNENVCCLLSDG